MRRLLLLTGAIVLVDTMFFTALTPLLPHYVDKLDLGKAGAGALQAMYPAGALVAAIPSGIVVAHLGVKRAVLIGLVLLAATTVAFGLASSVWALDVARNLFTRLAGGGRRAPSAGGLPGPAAGSCIFLQLANPLPGISCEGQGSPMK